MKRRPAGLALCAALALAISPACSLGQGAGSLHGAIDAPDCWSGPYDLKPDFFAAVPYKTDALELRIQKSGDFETFSDGLVVVIDDAGRVRGDPGSDGTARASLLGQPLAVSLPPAVAPPGVPVKPIADPAIVHAVLYLDRTCRTRNLALYALDAVTIEPGSPCDRPCDGSMGTAGDSGGGPVASPAQSTITFDSLFDGNPDEADAKERLSQARFELFLGDPREIAPGGLGPPPRCRGHMCGDFKFYFQRGRPAQPFP